MIKVLVRGGRTLSDKVLFSSIDNFWRAWCRPSLNIIKMLL
jgi:hypothetical protein